MLLNCGHILLGLSAVTFGLCDGSHHLDDDISTTHSGPEKGHKSVDATKSQMSSSTSITASPSFGIDSNLGMNVAQVSHSLDKAGLHNKLAVTSSITEIGTDTSSDSLAEFSDDLDDKLASNSTTKPSATKKPWKEQNYDSHSSSTNTARRNPSTTSSSSSASSSLPSHGNKLADSEKFPALTSPGATIRCSYEQINDAKDGKMAQRTSVSCSTDFATATLTQSKNTTSTSASTRSTTTSTSSSIVSPSTTSTTNTPDIVQSVLDKLTSTTSLASPGHTTTTSTKTADPTKAALDWLASGHSTSLTTTADSKHSGAVSAVLSELDATQTSAAGANRIRLAFW